MLHAGGSDEDIMSDIDPAPVILSDQVDSVGFIDDEDLPFSVHEFGSGDDVVPLPDSAGSKHHTDICSKLIS